MNKITSLEFDGCIIKSTTDFQRPITKKLYNYWIERCNMTPETGPQHENFELTDIIECAPYMMYKDVIDSGSDFKNRYWGTEIARAYSFEATGKTLCECYEGRELRKAIEFSKFVISKNHSVKFSGQLNSIDEGQIKQFEAAYLPLFDTTGSPTRYVAAYDFIE